MAREHPIELFMPPNMLKAKIGGSVGGIDLSAVKRAEVAMQALKAEFQDWISTDVANLNSARDAFAANRNATSIEKLYRASLDITGQAQTFEFPLVARVAKSLCDMLAALPEPAEVPMPLVDAHVNTIGIVLRDNVRCETDPIANELARELEICVAELAGSRAA
jgi:hypothetical protein